MALREVEERRRRDWFHGYPAPSRFHTISTPPQIEKEISQYLKDAYPEMNLHEGKDYTIGELLPMSAFFSFSCVAFLLCHTKFSVWHHADCLTE